MAQYYDDSYCRCRSLVAVMTHFPCPCAAKRIVAFRFKHNVKPGNWRHELYRLALRVRFIFRKTIAQIKRRTLS